MTASILDSDIYAGLSGVELTFDSLPMGEGVVLKRTYAHLMAPFIVAFSPPLPGKAHPAPWKSALGGASFDIHAELLIPHVLAGEGFSLIRVTWVICALMRMYSSPLLRFPVISNISFSEAKWEPDNKAQFLPVEVQARTFIIEERFPPVTAKGLSWCVESWTKTMALVRSSAEFALRSRRSTASTLAQAWTCRLWDFGERWRACFQGTTGKCGFEFLP